MRPVLFWENGVKYKALVTFFHDEVGRVEAGAIVELNKLQLTNVKAYVEAIGEVAKHDVSDFTQDVEQTVKSKRAKK